MALYQLRLIRLNGSTAVKRFVPNRFMVMPERKAYGNQINEQILCQKLFRVLSRLMNASTRCMYFRSARDTRARPGAEAEVLLAV